jgi:hypothetical protein
MERMPGLGRRGCLAAALQLGAAFFALQGASGALENFLHGPDFAPPVTGGAFFLDPLALVVEGDDVCHVNLWILIS